MAQKEIPCYLFVGMLESGKTKFIQETMEDPQFDSGDKTLLLICEEGEEEYDSERFAFGGVTVATIEDKAELNREHLQQLAEKSDCGRVIIEYNGMWLVQELYDALPDNWLIYQCLATADGDVIVHVTVKADPMFERDGYDVTIHVPITFSQAVLGDEIQVPSIDGKVEYTVPEGTQSGTTFRLRGKGIQYLNGRGRGDMYVKCEVEIPKKLNKAQRDALKKFEGTLKEENYEKRKGFFKKLKDLFN